jgi:CTP:molybdopterin cytidylyltransferase MocA
MGRPKALVELDGEPLVGRALRALADGGCAPVVVVLGAAAGSVRPLLPADAHVVEAADWEEGMGATLRAGLAAVSALSPRPDAALVHLVDLPGVTGAAIARLRADAGPDVLRRATYAGVPGHPVLIGRSHWPRVMTVATGDRGAREYLKDHPALELVDCTDLANGTDLDTPEQLARWARTKHP